MDGSRVDWIVENETDYYGILGVPRDASEKDIRRSYLSLALHLHPDKNLDNKKAAEAFNALNKAYNVLKDGRMRMLYDQKGVEGLHGLSADDLSFKNIVTTLARVLAAKTLISVARRLQVFEIMRENHEWVGPFIIWTPMDEFACFRKPHRDESRRFVFKAFTFVLLLLLCISLGHNVPRFLFGASHDEQEQSSLLRGPYAKLSRENPSEPGATFTFRVLSHNGNFTDVVVWRPSSISEEEATTLVRRWVDEMCPAERLLALASRERYNYTATLRPGRKLRAPPSPNRAAKHKWEFKGWKPKFKEFFPVRSAEELYVPSPLCGVLGSKELGMDARVKELMWKTCGASAPWEVAVNAVASLLQCKKVSHDVPLMYGVVEEFMRRCILYHKSADALRVYELFSRSGYVVGSPHHRRVDTSPAALNRDSLRSLSVDELALVALQQQPHRVHQSYVLTQMMAAEDEESDYVCDVPAPMMMGRKSTTPTLSPLQNDGCASCSSSFTTQGSMGDMFNVPFLGITELAAAEQFRILLQQKMQFLRETEYLQQRLGLSYLLSQMRHVVDDKQLSSEVEVGPLVCIGQAVLRHPFLFAKPSTESARQEMFFEDFSSPVAAEGLSEVQQSRLLSLEAVVNPLRSLCKEPLRFMELLTPLWDALFLRRAALTLILPADAHDVLPRSSNASSSSSSDGRDNGGGVCRRKEKTKEEENMLLLPACIDVFSELSTCDAASRVEYLINRRRHHNIIVPDAMFLLRRTGQLLQLARHREIVVPHSVLLDAVHAALDDQGPRRFHARRALLSLMQTNISPRERTKGCTRDNARRQQGGVTLLGMQDEVFILERSRERFFLNDALSAGDGAEESSSISHSSLVSVLVAKELGKLLSSSSSGYVTCSENNSSSTSEVDHLVAGIVASMRDEESRNSGSMAPIDVCGKPAPLFKSRSRSFWAHTPAVLATTSDATRRAAFMVGLSMFPPVSAA